MKLSYFIICLPSIFSVVEIIIELFVVCQKLIHVIKKYYYVLVHRNIICVDMHLQTKLAVSLFSIIL